MPPIPSPRKGTAANGATPTPEPTTPPVAAAGEPGAAQAEAERLAAEAAEAARIAAENEAKVAAQPTPPEPAELAEDDGARTLRADGRPPLAEVAEERYNATMARAEQNAGPAPTIPAPVADEASA